MLIGFAGLDTLQSTVRKDGALVYDDASRERIRSELSGKLVYHSGELYEAIVVGQAIQMPGLPAPVEFNEFTETQNKAGKTVLLNALPAEAMSHADVLPGQLPYGMAVIGQDDPRFLEYASGIPIYAEPQWYHKVGLGETGGLVVLGIGALGVIYVASRVL